MVNFFFILILVNRESYEMSIVCPSLTLQFVNSTLFLREIDSFSLINFIKLP